MVRHKIIIKTKSTNKYVMVYFQINIKLQYINFNKENYIKF